MPDIPAGAKFRTLTRRHQGGLAADDGGSRRGGRSRAADEMTTLTTSGTSDMDRWLERVFDQALDGTVDDLDDERTLSGRLKGGGDKTNQPSKVLRSPTSAQKPRPPADASVRTVMKSIRYAVLHFTIEERRRQSGLTSDALPLILSDYMVKSVIRHCFNDQCDINCQYTVYAHACILCRFLCFQLYSFSFYAVLAHCRINHSGGPMPT